MRFLRAVVATWFGSGFSPIAPGTAGTVATVPVVLALWASGSPLLHAVAAITAFVAGMWASRDAEARWGRSDPGEVVIDETAGYLVATLAVAPSIWTLGASFVLFRVFDVLKPWPASALERLPGSWGIMTDDVAAGLYANLLLQAWLAFAGGPA
jgi:phosphatidylglycerophosphatase A